MGLPFVRSHRVPKTLHRMARQNSKLFADDRGFNDRMNRCKQYSPGELGDRVCHHCGALLFVAESRPVPRAAWHKLASKAAKAVPGYAARRATWRARVGSCKAPRLYEGISCCHGGSVVLPPIRTSPVVEELFRGGTPKARVFREYTRKVNNAMAFASEKGGMKVAKGTYPSGSARAPSTVPAASPSNPRMHSGRAPRATLPSGFAPNYMVCGKLYHFVGPLLPEPGVTPAFAQHYVHDESARDDVIDARFSYIPISRGDAKRPQVLAHLRDIVSDLHVEMFRVNPYAHDFKMAADIFREHSVTDAYFTIDADQAPADAPARLYNNAPTGASLVRDSTVVWCRNRYLRGFAYISCAHM